MKVTATRVAVMLVITNLQKSNQPQFVAYDYRIHNKNELNTNHT